MASLHKRKIKSGTAYRIAYRFAGKQKTKKLKKGTTFVQAKETCRKYNELLSKGIDPRGETAEPITISEFTEWFLRSKVCSKRTRDAYIYAFSLLPETAISAVDPIEFEKRISKYSASSRSIIVRSLRAAWNFGIKQGVLKHNPFKTIPVSNKPRVPAVLTPDEKDRIYQEIVHPEALVSYP